MDDVTVLLDTVRLRTLIEEKYETQRNFARRIEVTPAYVSQLVRGDGIPTVERLWQISRALNTTMDSLVVGKDAQTA